MKPMAHFVPLLLVLVLGLPQTATAQPALQRERVRVPAAAGADKIRTEAVELSGRVGTPSPSPPPAAVVRPCPPAEVASRRVLPDDGVETTYVDGTVKVVHPDGRSLTTYPDGTSEEDTGARIIWRDKDGNVISSTPVMRTYAHVPRATPPDPPASGSTLDVWLARHNQNLLSALRALLANEAGGPESLNGYLAREQGMGLYDQIASRTELLERILNP